MLYNVKKSTTAPTAMLERIMFARQIRLQYTVCAKNTQFIR